MPRAKSTSKRRRLRKALTIAGVSLSVAGAASASAAIPAPQAASSDTFYDEEVSDVTLATAFYYFDRGSFTLVQGKLHACKEWRRRYGVQISYCLCYCEVSWLCARLCL